MRIDSSTDQQSLSSDGTALDPGKIFVGGLSWQTTNESLRQYFSQFGEVVECMVMKDQTTKRSRGFGFVNFADATSVDKVLASGPHDVDAKRVDPKKSFPRPKLSDGQLKDAFGALDASSLPKMVTRTKKMFVGGLSSTTSVDDVKAYFEQFGKVEDAMLMYDKQTQRHRGFAFVTFESEETVDKVVDVHYHDINNKTVECKKAQPKALMDAPTVKGLIPVGLTPVLAAYGRATGFPIASLPQYYAYTAGLPYGYLTTGTAVTGQTAMTSDRLLTATAGPSTSYFTPAADYLASTGATLGLMPLTRSNMAAAPTSPPIREHVQQHQQQQQQYVFQRQLMPSQQTAATTRGLLTLQDYATEYAMLNGFTTTGPQTIQFSPMSPIHNGFSQPNGTTLLPIGTTFQGATLTGIHTGYQ